MNKETILGIVRHILTFGGGLLATKGFIGASDVEMPVGALGTIAGIVWSAWDKSARAPST